MTRHPLWFIAAATLTGIALGIAWAWRAPIDTGGEWTG